MSNNKYWNLAIHEENADVADLYLYNVIDDYAYEGYSDSAESILKDINALGAIKTLNVYINSPGGSVFEGISIKNMLDRQKQKGCFINVVIDGLAASIASIIAMAGDKISMPSNALMMIHRASCGCWGNASDMAKQIEVLNKIDTVLTNTYVQRSRGTLTEGAIKEMFDSGDTWLTADQAKDFGLCDEIIEEVKAVAEYKVSSKEVVDLNKWANKVDEWFNEVTTEEEKGEEPLMENSNNQPVNVNVTVDVAPFVELVNSLKGEVAKLSDEIKNLKVVDEAEAEAEDSVENEATEDSVENEVENEATEDSVEGEVENEATEDSVEGEVEDEATEDSVEGEVEDEAEDACKKKTNEAEAEVENLSATAFDDFLKDFM